MKIEYVDSMGDDMRVVNAARVSFAKWKQEMDKSDERLIDFLARNGHDSPFHHPMLTFRCNAPIAIARQLWKSHIGLASQDDNVAWNEESRRYITSEPSFYVPTVWRMSASDKKQGSGIDAPHSVSSDLAMALETHNRNGLNLYNYYLSKGIAPEQLRFFLSQSAETNWIWTGSLMAFVRICKLRIAGDAQAEASLFATELFKCLMKCFPHSVAALMKNRSELK